MERYTSNAREVPHQGRVSLLRKPTAAGSSRRRLVAIALPVLVGVLAVALPAVAQDRAAARRAFDEATRQFELGNHLLALEGFIESQRLLEGDTRAQTLVQFNIARAQEELGRLRDALRSYELYLERAPSDAPYREQTLDRVRELRGRLNHASGPPEATAGETLSPIGPIVLGVGGAALIVGGVLGGLVLSEDAALSAMCDATTGRCPDGARPLAEHVERLALAADISFIAGGVIAATGLVLALILRDQPRDAALTAGCDAFGCTAQVFGRFW